MRAKIKLRTVNVVEISVEGVTDTLWAFADTLKGNKRAGAKFVSFIERYEKQNKVPPSDAEDISNYLDDGLYEGMSNYKLCLIHSV